MEDIPRPFVKGVKNEERDKAIAICRVFDSHRSRYAWSILCNIC